MIYVSLPDQSSILHNAIRQATCARDMTQKLPRSEEIVSDLNSVIARLEQRVAPIDELLIQREEA